MFEPIHGGICEVVNGLSCWVPTQPAKHLITGYDLPVKERKWKRTELPAEWEEWREEEELSLIANPDYVHPKIEAFKKQEWERRLFGYWFYVRDKVVYITGKHYFYVNWWKLDSGYPEYRDTDRRLFYFWQYCIEDPNCYGMVEMTLRRQGKTYRAGCETYEEISRNHKVSGGIQSKTGDDAQELFLEKLIEPFKDLPDFFKPEFNSGSDPKTVLSFFRDATKGKKARKVRSNQEAELRSFIDWKPAKEKAYDGKAKLRLIQDEAGKTAKKEADVHKRLKVIKPCALKNGKIWGKIYVSTTVEALDEGGAEFKMIWDESNHNDPKCFDENEQTKSGLYRYFLSALEGTFYDEYGDSVIENPTPEQRAYLIKTYGKPAADGAKPFFIKKRKALEDRPSDLSSEMRMFPFDEHEPFMPDGDKCIFNAYILGKTERELDLFPNIVTRGDFVDSNGKDSPVVFKHNPINGKYIVKHIPTNEETNKVEPWYMVDNVQQWKPKNTLKFAIAVDPVDHGSVTDEGRKSNAAAYVFEKFDLLKDDPNNRYAAQDFKNSPLEDWKMGMYNWKTYLPIVEYINRPDDPIEFYEDMIRICRFFGCKILAENQKVGIINHFKLRGYSEFVMSRPKATFTTDNTNQDTPGIPSSQPMIQQYCDKIASYVQHHGHRIPFIRLIKDLKVFDPKNPRKHDPTVAFGFLLIAVENQEMQDPVPIEVTELFRMYNNKGQSSLISQ